LNAARWRLNAVTDATYPARDNFRGPVYG